MAHPLPFAAASLIDITLPISPDMPVFPGDPAPQIRRISSIARGDALTASELVIGCHIGTHVDAPAHFLAEGKTVDQLGLDHFCGAAQVIDAPDKDRISAGDLRRVAIRERRHLLFKTKNSAQLPKPRFDSSVCFLGADAIESLWQFQPLSIGIDSYSLDAFPDTSLAAHRAVAERGLPAFVCLDLRKVSAGDYFYFAFPLSVPGLEACPVRAFVFPWQAP